MKCIYKSRRAAFDQKELEVNEMKEEKNFWPKGVKRTRQRESVLSVLESADKPLSATEICAKIQTDGEAAWMSTVYRVLELFEKKGMVIKTNMMSNEMAVYELNRFQHKHYAVCVNCHKVIAMENCPMEHFIPQIEEKDFQVMGHNLEIFGLCKDCRRPK